MKSPLIEALLNPKLYSHKVEQIELKETHISWVILTGEFAYKIKKPVDFKFLDYTKLEQRKHFCEEELRLNHRLAPTLYLEVVPIYGPESSPRFNGPGDIIEYAVKMRQFDSAQQFDVALDRGDITDQDMDEVAKIMADFHQTAVIADADSDFGSADQILQPVKQNFEQMIPLLDDPIRLNKLKSLSDWSEAEHNKLHAFFQQRREVENKIRECHGDFYMANIARFQGKVTIFDCIEFNEPFRFTDTMADVGFLMMDLLDKHHPDLAYRFLSSYMEYSDDYHGLIVLHYYTVYRAMVRLKINILRMTQEEEGSDAYQECQLAIDNLLKLALKIIQPPQRQIIMMHGFSGSGKSYLSNEILHLGMLHLRSDIIRKQIAKIPANQMSQSGVGLGLYTDEMNARTYHALVEKAHIILQAGYPVIIDATFLKREHRDCFANLGAELGIPWLIIDCRASHPVLVDRINSRLAQDKTSEATVDVLKYQEDNRDALTPIEREHMIVYRDNDVEAILNQLHNHMFMQATLIE